MTLTLTLSPTPFYCCPSPCSISVSVGTGGIRAQPRSPLQFAPAPAPAHSLSAARTILPRGQPLSARARIIGIQTPWRLPVHEAARSTPRGETDRSLPVGDPAPGVVHSTRQDLRQLVPKLDCLAPGTWSPFPEIALSIRQGVRQSVPVPKINSSTPRTSPHFPETAR